MEKPHRRIALVLPPRLASAVEQAAAASETSLSEYVRDALRRRLMAERDPEHQPEHAQ